MQTTLNSSSNPFAAFRHYNYRLWFFGQLISLIGSWMQNTAQGYLIFSLTGSQAYLGLVGFVSGIPSWVFMLYGGLIADRIPRRTMLIITQCIMMVLAFVLAGLVFLDIVQPWHILVLSFLLGVANAFDTPARMSLVADLVSREDMSNAIAYNSIIFNAGLIAGPAIGGMIYALTGPGWCFTINGASFIAVIIALTMMRVATLPAPASKPSALSAIKEGLNYLREDRLALTLTISTFFLNIFGFGLLVLFPAWAVNVLKGDVTTYGALNSARGVGALFAGLLLALTSTRGLRGKQWTVGSLLVPIAICIFALSANLSLSLALIAVLGFAMLIILNNNNAMVQSRVPDQLRGRVMSIYSLMFMGGGPIGSLLAGSIAEVTSAQTTAFIFAGALAIFAAVIWFFLPGVRAMK